MEKRFNGLNAVEVYREATGAHQIERSDTTAWCSEYKKAVRAHAFGVLDALQYIMNLEEYNAVTEAHNKLVEKIDY